MTPLPAPPIPEWISHQFPIEFTRYCLNVGGYNMHIMETGTGYPILMMHGNPTWGYLYRKVVEKLTDLPVRIILPDMIGLGFSDKPRNWREHTLENHLNWLGSAIDQLALKELLVVLQDWGGPLAGGVMARRPGLMKGLVVLNTILGPPRPGFKPTTFHKMSRMPIVSEFLFRVLGFPQAGLHRAQGDPSSIQGEVARAYKYPLKGWKNNAGPLALGRMVPNNMEHPSIAGLTEIQEYMSTFEGPTEIVWGKRDPILGKALKRMEPLFPHAHVEKTGAGHFIQEEEPELIAEAVRRVFEKVNA